MFPKSVSPSSAPEQESKGNGMATKRDEQAADYRAEAIAAPFAEAAERSVPVSKTGKPQSGLRTERITLELTCRSKPAEWCWPEILGKWRISEQVSESVRVVEEDRVLAASKKLIEVDQEAALRGFDTTTFQRLWISAIARVLGLELARPPRSKCDNPGDGSIPSPGILASPALVEAHQQITALTDQRDAAIRERDESRQVAQTFESLCLGEQARNKVLQARVEELEARTSTAGEGLRDAQAASSGSALARIAAAFGCEPDDDDDLVEAARLLVRERDEAVAKAASVGNRPEAPLSSVQAASGSGDPVAWMCEWTDHASLHRFKSDAEDEANGTVVPQPLYRAPPQPRGWLTEEERKCIEGARTLLRGMSAAKDPEKVLLESWVLKAERDRIVSSFDDLLARSTPPEVKLPRVYCHGGDGEQLVDIKDVRAALAAAGVPVKEVGRE
jgi:hypothetical protein